MGGEAGADGSRLPGMKLGFAGIAMGIDEDDDEGGGEEDDGDEDDAAAAVDCVFRPNVRDNEGPAGLLTCRCWA